MQGIETEILQRLFALQDLEYKRFQSKLLPTLAPDTVIGVRTPALRLLSKEYAAHTASCAYLQSLPHRYYEENNLHALILCRQRDYACAMDEVEAFLPFVDNWATCDMLRPPVFKRHRAELLTHVPRWLASSHVYTVRFGVGILLSYFLDEAFAPEQLALVAALRSEEYYINMAIAWYFATALAKQYDAAIPYLCERRLALWTHNKTIQKAVESYRITPEQKAYLRTLRIQTGSF